ncbi:MAG: hypothetical protein F4X18_09240 [Acidimicrobiia bacterium]|nr:hypothetical protein [Acidimicrobiia bacterium]
MVVDAGWVVVVGADVVLVVLRVAESSGAGAVVVSTGVVDVVVLVVLRVAGSSLAGAVVVSVTGAPGVVSPSDPAAAAVSVTAADGSAASFWSFSAPIPEST